MATTAPKPISIHQQLVDDILSDHPSAKPKGFMQALRAISDAPYMLEMYQHDRGWWQYVTFIPDAFLVDEKRREVVVFEAVHQHDVDQHKFAKMAEIGWALDEDEYDLVLMRCDRFSRTRYLPRLASIAHLLNGGGNDDGDIIHVDDWQAYTAEFCASALPFIPGVTAHLRPTPSEGEEG